MKNIELGVSTSATQIEGRNINSSWHNFSKINGNIKNNDNPTDGVNHLDNIDKDISLLKELNIKHYRLSFEWASLEPNKGEYNIFVLNDYIKEIKKLNENNINVMVCFHHFTNPIWFENIGGFSNKNNVIYFCNYVRWVVDYLKDLVNEYLTFNEPSIYAMQSYLLGIWPPLKKSFKLYKKVINNMSIAHKIIYKNIHQVYLDSIVKVSFAHSYMLTKGYKNSFLGGIASHLFSYYGNNYPLKKFIKGKSKSGYIDFIGLNYYSINYFKGFSVYDNVNLPKTDLGWNIYEKGIVISIRRMTKFSNKEIYITENGIDTKDEKLRIKFIHSHLNEIINSKYNVKRYYYWTLIDNFEWLEGYTPKFGLVSFDKETKIRTIKESGLYYKNLSLHELNDEKLTKYE